MNEGKQAQMEFPYIYPLKQMGTIISPEALPHTVHLSESFVRDYLPVGMFDADPAFQKKGEVTKVGCPFCKKGFLTLASVKPEYTGGTMPVPNTMRHVANNYKWICSNEECDGRFHGKYQWGWIG